MSLKYIIDEGKKVDLADLTEEQVEVLSVFYDIYSQERFYPSFVNSTMGSQAFLSHCSSGPNEKGHYWITSEVLRDPLYLVVRDLGHRLGEEQGFLQIVPSRESYREENRATLEEFLGIRK